MYDLPLDDLVAMEQGIRRSDKPPMAIWRAGTTFISEERYESGMPDPDEIIGGLLLEPGPRFARVYRDALHESYTVYDIDLDAGWQPKSDRGRSRSSQPLCQEYYALSRAQNARSSAVGICLSSITPPKVRRPRG